MDKLQSAKAPNPGAPLWQWGLPAEYVRTMDIRLGAPSPGHEAAATLVALSGQTQEVYDEEWWHLLEAQMPLLPPLQAQPLPPDQGRRPRLSLKRKTPQATAGQNPTETTPHVPVVDTQPWMPADEEDQDHHHAPRLASPVYLPDLQSLPGDFGANSAIMEVGPSIPPKKAMES